jgi:hypothetical protein
LRSYLLQRIGASSCKDKIRTLTKQRVRYLLLRCCLLWLALNGILGSVSSGRRIYVPPAKPFQVLDDVTVGDAVVVPRGGMAWGKLVDAHPSKLAGRGGMLALELETVAALTGEPAL